MDEQTQRDAILLPATEVEETEIYEDEVPEEFTWQASEYVHHHKGIGWYIVLLLVATVLLIIGIIMHQWLGIGVLIAMTLAIIVYAHRPPQTLTYKIDGSGITIESKHYPYNAFRSFSVVSDVEWHSIELEPTQRLMPRLSILFGEEDFDAIVDHLSLYMPRTDRTLDLVERISRYLRF